MRAIEGQRARWARGALAVLVSLSLLACTSDDDDDADGGGATTTSATTSTTDATGTRDPSLCPEATWMAPDLVPEERAEALVAALDPDQVVAQLHGMSSPEDFRQVPGIADLCIPDLLVTNGPAGIGASSEPLGGAPATALPSPLALAATWDPERAGEYGDLMGSEILSNGRNLLESPDIDLARTPLNGRTFEAFGEDPFLVSEMAVAQIEAVQDRGVVAMAKHFVLNNQEADRSGVDVQIDERSLRELYLAPFEAAVRRAGVASVMCSYNQVRGTYSCENTPLIDGVLRDDWGFEGFVQSDFGATHSTVGSVEAGMDLEMPGGTWYGDPMVAALDAGQVTDEQVHELLVRRYTQMFRLGLFDRTASVTPIDVDAHGEAAQAIAEAGTVLLRNEGGALPLDAHALGSIAVVGPWSDEALTGGMGSSIVTPLRTTSPVEGITDRVGDGVSVLTDAGTDPATAADVAARADVAVVVVGQQDTEGADRTDLALPDGQDRLVEAVAAANPNTIVVVHSGGPVTMPWLDAVPAVVQGWYPGQEDGTVTASILFGDADPEGQLPITFPRALTDLPTTTPEQYPGVDLEVTYSEGLEVGYRHYQANDVEPLFPFGFGLSYTDFTMAALAVPEEVEAGSDLGVELTVTNDGDRAGSTVAQVYVGHPDEDGAPPRQLRGFARVELDPGDSEDVTVTLDARSFAHWDDDAGDWVVTPGTYHVMVGSSSADLPLEAEVEVVGG